jgi:AraC-like DNA-binding protein
MLSWLLAPPTGIPPRNLLNRATLATHMLDRLGNPVSLEQSAREFGMGKARFCREVKYLLGTTYQKAMEREKMAWASTLLRDRSLGLGVAEVAHRVGYNDPLYFSKVFKRAHGLSPRRFQRETASVRGT